MFDALSLRPIGVIRTPFRDRQSAPRQPSASRDTLGTIALFPGNNFEHALSDVDAWDHIWVLFWFHLNDDWRPKVLPPRSTVRRGVFATRAPHRPNPIGLSVLRLDRVDAPALTLHVRDVDMIDGTPVLDIKPYVPYVDSVPHASPGWLEEPGALDAQPSGPAGGTGGVAEVEAPHGAVAPLRGARERLPPEPEALRAPRAPLHSAVAPPGQGALSSPLGGGAGTSSRSGPGGERGHPWPPPDPGTAYEVLWEPLAREQAAWIAREDDLDLAGKATAVLVMGPQPHPYRRIRRHPEGFCLALKAWRVHFRVDGRCITVTRLATGYRARDLAASLDPAVIAHRSFLARFGDGAR